MSKYEIVLAVIGVCLALIAGIIAYLAVMEVFL
mgnify:CR=1 FL=1